MGASYVEMPQFLISKSAEALLVSLCEALDLVDFGIALLDQDMRVRFANRRCGELWGMPQELLATAPTYQEVLTQVAGNGRCLVHPAARDDYVAQRESAVRIGYSEPTAIDLTDGRQILCRCIAKADGGRILIYTDISPTKAELEQQREVRDAVERASADFRFSNETLENQASYLVSLAEESDINARRAEEAKQQLEHEIAERLQLEAELLRLATTDALTGALNRREFFTVAQQELVRVRELGQGLAVLMADIDHFKSINDEYGHPAGDEALKHVVTRLRVGARHVDLIGRLGGEEFAIVLPGVTTEAALKVAERVRASVAKKPFLHNSARIHITISIGLSMARDTDSSIEPVITRADQHLYQAKRSGRNRVCQAEAATPTAPGPGSVAEPLDQAR